MAMTYQFTWTEIEHIETALALAKKLVDDVNIAHVETDNFDLDIDQIGARVRIPHDRVLTAGRNST